MNKSHNKLRFVRRTLYRLKRRFGVPATLYRLTVSPPDRVTGNTGSTISPFYVDKMIFLPEKTLNKFMYGASVGSNIARGASFQIGDREIIIDARDLPKDFVVGTEDYVVIDNKHYEMVNIVKFETNAGWYLTVRWIQQAPLNQVLQLRVQPFLFLQQTIFQTKNAAGQIIVFGNTIPATNGTYLDTGNTHTFNGDPYHEYFCVSTGMYLFFDDEGGWTISNSNLPLNIFGRPQTYWTGPFALSPNGIYTPHNVTGILQVLLLV